MSTESGLALAMSKENFNPENFVKQLSKSGQADLVAVRQQIQQMQDETARALKENVYKNYEHFIDTAKEISILETELYQLSHMLTDQKSVLTTLMELSITGSNKVETPQEPEAAPPEEDHQQKSLALLLEKVEGCSSVTDVPGRMLVHDSDLSEIDPESFDVIRKVHVFLLNDSVMIAENLPHRRGPIKYRFESLLELDSLAVVNARDVGPCKNAFKILRFPDTYMFIAESAKAKRHWLDILEDTKRKKSSRHSHARKDQRASTRLSSAVTPGDPTTPGSAGGNDLYKSRFSSQFSNFSLTESTNPFSEDDDNQSVATDDQASVAALEVDLLAVEWIQELPEDLDVCIAQRDFEGAVNLVNKVNDYLQECPKSPAIREYRARIELRVKSLTEVLVNELQVTPERSLRGGPRAARRAVTQLIRLRKSAQACDLFLKNRSLITKYNIQQLKIEGATNLYVKRLSEVFFTNLKETGQEFLKAFPDHYGCFSTFVVWAKSELAYFMKLFSAQVFTSKSNLTNVSECVNCAKLSCAQLTDIGLDISFTMELLMLSDIQQTIKDSVELQLEAVKHRATDDVWRPINYQNAETLTQFEKDMAELGFKDIAEYSFDECFTYLTSNFVHFCRSFLTYTQDVLRLYTDDTHQLITESLLEITKAQLAHAERSVKSPQFQNAKEQNCILKNAKFLVHSVLPLIVNRYKSAANITLSNISQIDLMMKRIDTATKSRTAQLV